MYSPLTRGCLGDRRRRPAILLPEILICVPSFAALRLFRLSIHRQRLCAQILVGLIEHALNGLPHELHVIVGRGDDADFGHADYFPSPSAKRTLTLTLACSSRSVAQWIKIKSKTLLAQRNEFSIRAWSYQARIVMRDSSSRRVFLHRIANLEGQDILFKNMDLTGI